jgi:transposase
MSSIRTRQERERLVLDLYNQGKTIREIAKEVRMSFRDIGVILNKTFKEKTEVSKEQRQDNNGVENNQQELHLSLAAQAYKLFSDRKTPLEVAIALNLRESEATKFYKEYWKLKQLHNLSMVYEETKGNLEPFLKLYKLSKAAGMSARHVINLLEIANTNLPDIQRKYERLKREVSTLEFNKQQSNIALSYFNNQIEMKNKALTSYHISCIRERREIEKLYNEKAKPEAIVTGFKSNNEEYLNKIKQAAYEEVKHVLTDGKLILKFATLSVIESLRMNSELYNFVIHDNSNNTIISYGPNYPSLMLSGQQHQQQSFNDSYTALILEDAEKLYNKLITEFTNRVTEAATLSIGTSSLPSDNNNRQKLTHKNDI